MNLNELLLSCLHEDAGRFPSDDLDRLTTDQWDSLVKRAVEYRVGPLLHHRIASAGLASKAGQQGLRQLEAYSREVARKNLFMFAELQRYLQQLESNNIPVILLKGVYLAHKIYPGGGLREMNDMDLLFRKTDLKRASDLLLNMGYEPVKPLHIDYEIRKSHHLPPMIKAEDAVFEIHWNITKPGKPYNIEPDGLWERAQSGTVLGSPVRFLSPEDLLLHLCIHTSYQHMFSFGLRPFCDIAATIRHFGDEVDWDQLIRRAEAYRWQKGIYLALLAAKEMMGANVPQDIIQSLKPEDAEPKLLSIGKEQVFMEKYVSASVPQPMVDLVESKGIIHKIKTVWNRIFLPREFMVTRYPVQPGSVKIYWYYLVRLWEAVRDHSVKLFRIYRGDQKLGGIVERKNMLNRWLNE